MIEGYSFGEIKVSGKTYTSDVIIYPDRIDAHWWRKQGHHLDISDIQDAVNEKPDVIIIGTGQPGLMKVDSKTKKALEKLGITTIVLPTERACQEYNRIAKEKTVIACLHLTC